jgi:hypothetical protein
MGEERRVLYMRHWAVLCSIPCHFILPLRIVFFVHERSRNFNTFPLDLLEK